MQIVAIYARADASTCRCMRMLSALNRGALYSFPWNIAESARVFEVNRWLGACLLMGREPAVYIGSFS